MEIIVDLRANSYMFTIPLTADEIKHLETLAEGSRLRFLQGIVDKEIKKRIQVVWNLIEDEK